jgi:hypothetical protein
VFNGTKLLSQTLTQHNYWQQQNTAAVKSIFTKYDFFAEQFSVFWQSSERREGKFQSSENFYFHTL